MDLYEILEVGKTADIEEIKRSYKRLAKRYHPDRNPGDDEATEKFKDVQEAYDALSDPNKRAEYDRFGTVGRRPPMSAEKYNKTTTRAQPRTRRPGDFSNTWEEFFGGSPDRGRSIQVRVEISLEEAFQGVKKTIKTHQLGRCNTCEGKGYTAWDACSHCAGSGKAFLKQAPFNIFVTCNHCRGTGRSGTNKCADCLGTCFTPMGDKFLDVDIPAGADNGMQVRLMGEGEPGKNGAKAGDIAVVVVVKTHNLYKREGSNLFIDVIVPYTELVFGAEYQLPLLTGEKITFKVPKGTQGGTRFRIKGHGFPNLYQRTKGDLIVTTKLEVPASVAGEYESALEKLKDYEKINVTPKRKEFLNAIGQK